MPNRVIRYKLGWSFSKKVGLVAIRWGEGDGEKIGYTVTAKELAAIALLLDKPPVFFDPATMELIAEVRTGLTTSEAHGIALKSSVSPVADTVGELNKILDAI